MLTKKEQEIKVISKQRHLSLEGKRRNQVARRNI